MGKLNASETTLEIILNDKTRDGDQAVAYFLNLYTGEHSGGELLCNAINRGKRMLPLIESYTRCLPITGLEPLSDDLDGSGFLPRHAKKAIENGERCTDHQ